MHRTVRAGATPLVRKANDGEWLDKLYSRNPSEVEAATAEVAKRGAAGLPAIQAALRDPQSEAERLKGALKACAILGKTAAPAIADVASVLPEPGLTAEAAIALSNMGPDAFAPLREGSATTIRGAPGVAAVDRQAEGARAARGAAGRQGAD